MGREVTSGMFETQFIVAAILFVTAFLMGVLTKNPRTHRRWLFVGLGLLAFYTTTNALYWWGRMPLRLFPFALAAPIAANIGLWTGWLLRSLVQQRGQSINYNKWFAQLAAFGVIVGFAAGLLITGSLGERLQLGFAALVIIWIAGSFCRLALDHWKNRGVR